MPIRVMRFGQATEVLRRDLFLALAEADVEEG